MNTSARSALRIALVYAIVAAGWIAFSDMAARWIFSPETAAVVQTYKGLFFVAVSGFFLFYLIRRSLERESATRGAYVETQQRWKKLVENTTDAVIIIEGVDIVFANAAAAALTGVDGPEELVGHPIGDFLIGEDVDRADERIQKLIDGAQVPTHPYTIRRLDGGERSIEAHSTSIRLYDQPVVLTILVDVTEREEQRRILVQAKEEAEELARMKTTILNNMSHEIRTPLTGIVGLTDMLGDLVTGEAEDVTRLLDESSWRLMRTLDSILMLAQLESDAVTFVARRIDVVASVRESMRIFEPQFAAKEIDLRYEGPEDPAYVATDPAALDQILMNVLSNAAKFTSRGRAVVRLGVDKQSFSLEVQDTGVGISEEFLPHVFDEYAQESQGLTRKFEGTGLGLTIVKHLVGRLGGEVYVTSEKDVGTAVRIELPASADARLVHAA